MQEAERGKGTFQHADKTKKAGWTIGTPRQTDAQATTNQSRQRKTAERPRHMICIIFFHGSRCILFELLLGHWGFRFLRQMHMLLLIPDRSYTMHKTYHNIQIVRITLYCTIHSRLITLNLVRLFEAFRTLFTFARPINTSRPKRTHNYTDTDTQ